MAKSKELWIIHAILMLLPFIHFSFILVFPRPPLRLFSLSTAYSNFFLKMFANGPGDRSSILR